MQFLLILNGKAKRSAGKRNKMARQIRNDLGSKGCSVAWGLCNRGLIVALCEMGLGLFQRQKIQDLGEKLLTFYS